VKRIMGIKPEASLSHPEISNFRVWLERIIK
jgi:hypothetical protein